jgi:glycosyltransferase involved in cell wall biosynthesis
VTRVLQLLAAAAPGDAVTGQALAWSDALRRWGMSEAIAAEHVHPALAGRVTRLAGRRPAADVLILHYSVWGAAAEVALAAPEPLALCYHNVTPGDLLRAWNPALAADCDRARAELGPAATRASALLADSAFNAGELRAAGGREVAVVPLLLDLPAPPPPRPAGAPPRIVSVGRIVPNKRLDDVLRAFVLYQRAHAPGATLTLVGSDDGFADYGRALRDLAGRLGARGVTFTGRVSASERDRVYARADAYLCMSEHEGFCVPLLEAMAHGVPVVARAAAAVPETLGGAGIAVSGPDALPLAAEALHEAVSSPGTRAGLAAAAAARLQALRAERVEPALRAALAPVLGAA